MSEVIVPLSDELEQIWSDDLLSRRADAEFLINFLLKRTVERAAQKQAKSYVLNLDSAWGKGKSFFLKHLRDHLSKQGYLVTYVNAWEDDHADDPLTAIMSAIDEVISPATQKNEKLKKAWHATKKNGREILHTFGKSAIETVLKRVLGEGLEEIKEQIEQVSDETKAEGVEETIEKTLKNASLNQKLDRAAEASIQQFRRNKKSIQNFKERLAGLLNSLPETNEKHPPLFVLA